MSVLGIISTVSGKLSNAIGDRDNRLHVVTGGTPVIYSITGAAAISLLTTIGKDYHRPVKLKQIQVTFSTAPTTSESVTLTHNVYGDGSRPSPVIFSINPASEAATSIIRSWVDGYLLSMGDELTLAFTNTDTRTVKASIVLEIL
jgi:hypothetical protein